MMPSRFVARASVLFLAGLLLAGCGHREGDGQEHGNGEAHVEGDGHDHGDESPSGVSFKEGRGVILRDETREILGLEVADVEERVVPLQIRLTLQVFGEQHRHGLNLNDHAGCDVHGSGFLPAKTAAAVRAGLPVQVAISTNPPLKGVVLAVQKALALGESEVLVGVSNATALLKVGEFVPARIDVSREEATSAIPGAAVLRTAEGTFVYTVNGDAYLRTAVQLGAEADGWIEVTDGLLAGDQVVTKPLEALWLIELRATKGGGHTH